MYAEPAAFKKAGALAQAQTRLRRMLAPVLAGFAPGYAAVLLTLWETHFPTERQVTLTDFEAATFFQRLCGWNDRQYAQMLEALESSGAINLDKHMRPWIMTRRAEAQKYWRSLYDELA
jgi:hypothetical protein